MKIIKYNNSNFFTKLQILLNRREYKIDNKIENRVKNIIDDVKKKWR